jgi:hypothetical protein
MPSPFPGMDPFLEDHTIWPDVHARIAVEITNQLNPRLGPKYYATVEVQSSPGSAEVGITQPVRPDVSVYESIASDEPMDAAGGLAIAVAPFVLQALPAPQRTVRIYHTQSREVVTAIEILSPTNKRPGNEGLAEYRRKRLAILHSQVHLIELDLLRGGVRPGAELDDLAMETDYIVLVNRGNPHRLSETWPVALDQPLPVIPTPLLAPDPDVGLDLTMVIRTIYANGAFDRRIGYHMPPPPPPLRPAMQAWVERLLAEHAQVARL